MVELSCLGPILQQYSTRITSELRPRLHGMFGAVIRGYLPQRWQINADGEVFTIVVDAGGHCSVVAGAEGSPDVNIVVGHDRLRAALERRDPRVSTPGPYVVTFQSSKGATAYQFLRSRLGL